MSLQQRLHRFALTLFCMIALTAAPVFAAESKEGSFTTKDGVRLHYIEAGTGVSQALAEGVPVYDRAYNQNVGSRGFHTMYRDLTNALKARIDAL